MSSARDVIRTALLATPKFRTKEIEHNGAVFLVRQPNTRIGKMISAGEDAYAQMMTSVIECTFTKGDGGEPGVKVFEAGDVAALMEQPQDSESLLGKVIAALGELSKAASDSAKKA